MNEQKREFTGIWIPRIVVEDDNLSWIERALYAEIACYKQCFMSNAFFANRLGVSERYVQEMLAKLKALGHIEDVGFDGRKRYLRAVYDGPVRGRGEPQFVADTNHSSPIDNNIDNNIESSETKVSRLESVEEDDLSVEVDEDMVPTRELMRKRKPKSIEPEIKAMWALWPKPNPNWRINKSQRLATENLLQYGQDQVMKAIQYWQKHKADPFCPDVSTPFDLDAKWNKLLEYRKKRNS